MPVPCGLAFLAAFLAALIAGPWIIRRMHALKFGQNINSYVPEHQAKQGTPTMGGWLLVIGVLVGVTVSSLVDAHINGRQTEYGPMLAVLSVFLAHVAIGFTDDYLSIKRGKNLGLRARDKLLAQFVVACCFVLWLAGRHGFSTFVWFGGTVQFGFWYYAFVIVLMMGLSNATNLTDGLDALAGSTSLIAAIGVSLTVFQMGSSVELPWFGYSLAGACLGFLWFNAHPAKIFMGDTGSLAIGASLTAMAIIGKQEILLLIFSIVFIIEAVSVMIQVTFFKYITKGKRVFLMTPIHHHFQKQGWPETVVVARFIVVGVIALIIGLMLRPYVTPY